MRVAPWLLLAVTVVAGIVPASSHAVPGCGGAASVAAAYTCFSGGMGGAASLTWQEPNGSEQQAWQQMVTEMVGGGCGASTLPGVVRFEVAGTCILMDQEDADADGAWDRGWGAAFVRLAGGSGLHLSAPHVQWDTDTGWQALDVFEGTEARSLTVSGTHRHARPGEDGLACLATCAMHAATPNHLDDSDMAHANESMFQAATRALAERRGVFIQFHGMRDDACPGVDGYVTEGDGEVPEAGSPARRLRDALRSETTGTITNPGDQEPDCSLNGGVNRQRDVVRRAGGTFLHVEQTATLIAQRQEWIDAVSSSELDASEPGPATDLRLFHCRAALDVRQAFDCLRERMGQVALGDYVAPTDEEREAWGEATAEILNGTCGAPPGVLADRVDMALLDGICILVNLNDENGNGRVDQGWGMVAIRMNSTSTLHFQSSQPVFVANGARQAMELFARTDARSFTSAGTHPDAELDGSSDADVRNDTMLQAATRAIAMHDGSETILWQPHGMYDTACGEMRGFLTEGSQQPPAAGSAARRLAENATRLFNLTIVNPGDPGHSCALDGSDNAQGPVVRSAGGQYLHMQQKAVLLEPARWPTWVDALVAADLATAS